MTKSKLQTLRLEQNAVQAVSISATNIWMRHSCPECIAEVSAFLNSAMQYVEVIQVRQCSGRVLAVSTEQSSGRRGTHPLRPRLKLRRTPASRRPRATSYHKTQRCRKPMQHFEDLTSHRASTIVKIEAMVSDYARRSGGVGPNDRRSTTLPEQALNDPSPGNSRRIAKMFDLYPADRLPYSFNLLDVVAMPPSPFCTMTAGSRWNWKHARPPA
jgi:hypothetical protein